MNFLNCSLQTLAKNLNPFPRREGEKFKIRRVVLLNLYKRDRVI